MLAKLASSIAILCCVILLPLTLQAAQAAPPQQFATIDPPGSTSTSPGAINNLGQIVGSYIDEDGVNHGFLLSSGVYTTIDVSEAIATLATGINNLGQIVGWYEDGEELFHGFLLSDGTFTTIDDPAFFATFPVQIGDLGEIVGYGIDDSGNIHGFTLINGTFTTIDFPNANLTQPLDMNFNETEIVGAYTLPSFPAKTSQGFTDIGGVFASVTFPGSASTALNGVNNDGLVAGTYVLPDESNSHAFLLSGTTFTTEDFPGAVSTGAANINDLGQIVGGYVDANNVLHGYLETSGPFAYVANSGSNTVSMIDIPTQLVVNTIAVGSGPWGVAISPDGTQVYVTNSFGNNVSVISTASSTVVATIPVQSDPQGVAFTPDGTSAYVANGSSSTVSVIDTTSQTVTATVQVGSNPVGVAMALTSNGTFAYVSNSGSNNVSVIAVGAEPEVVQTINVGSNPYWVAVSPNSSLAYVENGGSNNVSVISIASNAVTATIPVGVGPNGAAFSPDSSIAYVTNEVSNTVSVISTASSSVVATVPGFHVPVEVAVTTDGSAAYVTNLDANNVSVITTATNTITATVGVGVSPVGIAIASAPPTTLQITQPLSPTQLNVFDFGTNHQGVQYPPGTTFSGINMTTAAVQITPAAFQARVAGTEFEGALCIVYAGAGGNCVDYQVTCSNSSGSPIACPSEAQPTILVQTGFSTSQAIVNPGYLTTPLGENQWTNIFTGLSDPTVKGKTKGFGGPLGDHVHSQVLAGAEFVAVSLGATNPQGPANFKILFPQRNKLFKSGQTVPIAFQLTSVANGTPVTDATAGITVTMIADANGNPTSVVVLSLTNAFKETTKPGVYKFGLCTTNYAAGTYRVTIFGNAFPSYQFQFGVVP